MPELILGPLLRYVGPHDATVWVETNTACEVEVLGHRCRTFHVAGHHYTIIYITNLTPGNSYEYAVTLDGLQVWPEAKSKFPPSTIYTPHRDQPIKLAFGSCRIALPYRLPYTLSKEQNAQGRGIDALHALSLHLLDEPPNQWPHALLFLGDQVYADEVSPGTRNFIRTRRNPDDLPGEEIADFEEYTRLYWDAWGEPTIRWLLSTIPSAMVFDDHDVNDDWNISAAWATEQRAKPWWKERIVGGFMSYWIYQHLGNLSPRELNQDDLLQRVRQTDDAGPLLREFATRADHDPDTCRWSFYRDFGTVRLLMIDSRAARVLSDRRAMVDAQEWQWIEECVHGEFDHLLLGTSLPVLLGPGIHYLEAWSEAVCAGVWGTWPSKFAERLRRALDLEHWSAFQRSFKQLVNLLREVGKGARGSAPATIVMLSGDVHHAYLAEATFPCDTKVHSAVYQAVCSPFRNALDKNERRIIRAGWSKMGTAICKTLAHAAGIRSPDISWHLVHEEPWFDNQVAILELSNSEVRFRIDKPIPTEAGGPRLEEVFNYCLVRR
ncbi:MAG TPA: alkaline phosphatase D family protein [Gammaproteobacteria bacterium]|nr:alkaline phosphatase D family protein [Gammaproteobacteria bacterium]